MSLKSFKPVTPSNRYKVWPSFDEITKMCIRDRSLMVRSTRGRKTVMVVP